MAGREIGRLAQRAQQRRSDAAYLRRCLRVAKESLLGSQIYPNIPTFQA
jgi:hypothetical protein